MISCLIFRSFLTITSVSIGIQCVGGVAAACVRTQSIGAHLVTVINSKVTLINICTTLIEIM